MYVFLGLSCASLVLLVLIQQGKGAGVGFSMGGASQAMFGGSGGRDFFIKLTGGIAVCFLTACMILGKMSATPQTQYDGALKNAAVPAAPSPVLPATAAPAVAAPVAAAKPVVPAAKPAAPVAAPAALPKK